jgi:hypothetical protein
MYNIKINSWGRVITIAALMALMFYMGYKFNQTFETQKLKAAHASKQLDF